MKSTSILAILLVVPIAESTYAASSQIAGRISPDGKEEIQCDLPAQEHLQNAAGRDGSGLCVFSSLEIAAHWQNVAELHGFQKKMQSEPGGGWPEKVDAMVAKYAPHIKYLQYNGGDPAVLKLALKTGRMPAVTYGYSPRYGGRIAHMVNLVHLSERWAAVLDNNFPGEDRYEWMPPAEFYRRWQMNGGGWAIVLLGPPPPPIPTLRGARFQRARNGTLKTCPTDLLQEIAAMIPLALMTVTFWGPLCPAVLVPQPVPEPQPDQAQLDWRTKATDPNRVYLFEKGIQVGGYDYAEDYYRPYDAATDQWGAPGRPPVEPPALTLHNFVVRSDLFPHLNRGEESYRLNGQRISSPTAFQALALGDALADDSGKLRLTVVGSESACGKVIDDLDKAPELVGFKDKLLVQSYRPDNWAVAPFKLPDLTSSDCYIGIQKSPGPNGRGEALHAQRSYPGPALLAVAIREALRKADPTYQPDKVPDLTRPPSDPEPSTAVPHDPSSPPALCWLCCWLFSSGKRQPPRSRRLQPAALQPVATWRVRTFSKRLRPWRETANNHRRLKPAATSCRTHQQ
jgi:hypothetical protein